MSIDDPRTGGRPGPPGGARDRNRKRRTAALDRASLRLFLARGISGVTVDDLARAAKMAKGSFYRYADGKSALVARLIDPLTSGVTGAFDRCRVGLSAADRDALPSIYMRLAGDLAEIVRVHPDLVRLYLQESRAPVDPDRESVAGLARFIREGASELTELAGGRGLLTRVPAWLSAAVVVGAAEELLLDHLTGARARDTAEVQAALVTMVLHGIAQGEPTSR